MRPCVIAGLPLSFGYVPIFGGAAAELEAGKRRSTAGDLPPRLPRTGRGPPRPALARRVSPRLLPPPRGLVRPRGFRDLGTRDPSGSQAALPLRVLPSPARRRQLLAPRLVGGWSTGAPRMASGSWASGSWASELPSSGSCSSELLSSESWACEPSSSEPSSSGRSSSDLRASERSSSARWPFEGSPCVRRSFHRRSSCVPASSSPSLPPPERSSPM